MILSLISYIGAVAFHASEPGWLLCHGARCGYAIAMKLPNKTASVALIAPAPTNTCQLISI